MSKINIIALGDEGCRIAKKFEQYAIKIGVTKSRIIRRLLQKEGIFDKNQ